MTHSSTHFRDKFSRFDGIIGHYESVLGRFSDAWTQDMEGTKTDVKILRWQDQPIQGATAYLTAGLSMRAFVLPSGESLYQELILSAYDRFAGEHALANMLFHVATLLSAQDTALQLYNIVGPFESNFSGTDKCALFVAPPVYFPPKLAVYETKDQTTYPLWLVPITRAEATFIYTRGAEAFETLMHTHDPDVLDLSRLELPLP